MTSIAIKEIGKDFLTLCAAGNSKEAFKLYVHKNFKHHNAFFKGDADSLMIAMEESSKENPNRIFDIKHIIMDGDLVAYHSYIKQTQSDVGLAVVHILKFSDNKIIEMWDMHQPIPENMVNENGMF
jgi:predicted SnoaL-like aldol condensation-catalyzing enzyme